MLSKQNDAKVFVSGCQAYIFTTHYKLHHLGIAIFILHFLQYFAHSGSQKTCPLFGKILKFLMHLVVQILAAL